MSDKLRIEFEWLNLELGSEIDRAFAASIGVAVGEDYLTRLDDLGAKTVSNRVRACAWHLAAWLAGNWWRLRWEPEAKRWWKDTDWRLAHSIAAAGGGYVWPNAVFASDGEAVEVAMSPKSKSVPFEPIRYLNHIQARVTAVEFEQRVDEFMEGVLSRLDSLGLKDKSLPELWAEILAERQDPETSERRKLEAMAGYDPDEAPDELLAQLLEDRGNLGRSALEEVAAEARHDTREALEPIRELGKSRAMPMWGGCRVSMPELDAVPIQGGRFPWQQASNLAELAREKWGLGSGPISNEKLADLLGAVPETVTAESVVPISMPLALRAGKNGAYDLYFNRRRLTTRRFAICRLIGDHLCFANQERLRPATGAKTVRQKFQRAFAQEFLCPINALLDRLGTHEPDEDDLSEAAAFFEVSPLMVKTTLVNKGALERETLAAHD